MLARATDLLARLRATDVADRIGGGADAGGAAVAWAQGGVRFAASSPAMETQYYRAVRELCGCIRPMAGRPALLQEGGVYPGCWMESTGSISAELLSRFLPEVAAATFTAFADNRRADGLLPYKLTADGPAFAQIQMVTPLARSVWAHHALNGRDRDFLATMYAALAEHDAWLARWRDTRGSGGVEAFCTYDTGHDLSARFWHVPDSPPGNDPARYDTGNPLLPFIAPDLTANVACQRRYLARMAEELGEDGDAWRTKAAASEAALFAQCHDAEDGFFYDRDRQERLVKVQSDVLLRVLACEIGDDDFFATALSRYLLNTRKFFARFPFTSIALDDPRFDPAFDYNSWSGPTNMLSLVRAAHAFEAHERHVELSWAMQPTLAALFRAERFAQTLNPFTGREGFTEAYSPALLCLVDFVERLCGILPRPDGELWFTCLAPAQIEHRDATHETAYGRRVDGIDFELVNGVEGSTVLRDGEVLFSCPRGVRLVTDRSGKLLRLVGMVATEVAGEIGIAGQRLALRISGNEQLGWRDGQLVRTREGGWVPPNF